MPPFKPVRKIFSFKLQHYLSKLNMEEFYMNKLNELVK